MIFKPLAIAGSFQIDLEQREDTRGFFARLFCEAEFAERSLITHWPQMNTSLTRTPGTVRGMHFQRAPFADVKLVRCLRGGAHDVIVDLRSQSPTFGHWLSVTLTASNRSMIYIPKGCAHGFQTLEADTELLYMHGMPYSPQHDAGLYHADPTVGIVWPLPVTELSLRDAGLPHLAALEPFTE